MAAEGTHTKTSVHIRSNSFPSARHPLVSQFEEHLQRLKASEATSSSTSSAISHKLNGLQDLHDCIDKLLQLPITQQALARDCCNELQEGSLRLLDICGTAKDALLQSKDSIHELQSDVRRRRGSENTFTIAGGKYLTSKKKVKKAILKTLRDLKQIKNEFIVPPSNKDNETLSMLRTLKEAEAATMRTLESLLLFISKGHSKKIRWSVISKLMQPKRVACDSEESDTNEFEKVDMALQSLISLEPFNIVSIENFQKRMENLEMCIQDLEEGVECLSRQLIRTRVSLLNIFNH